MIITSNSDSDDRILVKKLARAEQIGNQQVPEVSLRPQKLTELIGRQNEKHILSLLVHATKKKWEKSEKTAADHVLFYGPPGLGKTTLAHILANELGVTIKVTSGPAIERQADLIAILTNLAAGDVLFIDEIHRLRKPVEELLYPAMEDFQIDIIVGQGTASQSVRFTLPPFTLVGATTRIGLLSSPLRDRFGVHLHLDFYATQELEMMLERLVKQDHLQADAEALTEIARRARGTARIAVRLLRRVKEFALVHGEKERITQKIAADTLDLLGIDVYGLDRLDQAILRTMIEKYDGGPVGLKTLAAAVGEDEDTLEAVYEPYLMRAGFLKRTSRGRMVTKLVYEHLGQMI
ncbi:MAG: Holliday junction branch migration DNA helicase RuvB [Candidatus Dojkabacteria bacterium]|nr:MAG: Holliday junction branch migration DNA helicase RuvB [Candidatus Dojkabacteria bacterium]